MGREVITSDQGASAAKSKPQSSKSRNRSPKPKPTSKRKRRDGAKPNGSPKKTNSTPKSKSSLAQSKNLPPSSYLRPVITSTGANGEGGAVQWVNVGIEPAPAQIRTMAERVESRMLIIIAGRQGGTPEVRAAYAAQLQQMRQELGAGDDPLETLLIERIALTWLRLMFVEEQASYTLMGNSSAALAEQWDRRLNDANSRFLRSCTALARVRKLRQRPRGVSAASAAAINSALDDSLTRGLKIAGKLLAKRGGR